MSSNWMFLFLFHFRSFFSSFLQFRGDWNAKQHIFRWRHIWIYHILTSKRISPTTTTMKIWCMCVCLAIFVVRRISIVGFVMKSLLCMCVFVLIELCMLWNPQLVRYDNVCWLVDGVCMNPSTTNKNTRTIS